ncbi:hypothetical protein F8144_00700 [Streptomyces triticiradicis]|uniref:Uncharacterized protein n=1 Tax=Streptomyces triticiradicis TaxID=2651189 RepID=A0A7J5DP88_9ACTN|nr:hypothetical protein F8144_00700 [Streptomyces triticiradicis]
MPRQATFAPSRRPARPLAAPAESPSTSSTRTSGRHSPSLRPGGPPEHAPPSSRLRSSRGDPHDAAPSRANVACHGTRVRT